MPKMVYVKGVGYVRAGSWSTKPVTDQWRLTQKQLEDAALMLVSRLRHLFFDDKSAYSRSHREVYEQHIIGDLEYLRAQIDELLQQFPKERRALAMENTNGRTPEEAAIFAAKAKAIRESM